MQMKDVPEWHSDVESKVAEMMCGASDVKASVHWLGNVIWLGATLIAAADLNQTGWCFPVEEGNFGRLALYCEWMLVFV